MTKPENKPSNGNKQTGQNSRTNVEKGGYRPTQSAPRTPPTKPGNGNTSGGANNNAGNNKSN